MRSSLTLAAVLAIIAGIGAAAAQSQPQSSASVNTGPGSAPQTAADAKPGAVAYPNNPAGTPVADDKGAPVVTDKAACPSAGNGRCPGSPQPSGSASEGSPASQAGVAAKP